MAGRWWVYVVRCADGTLYTGVARDLLARLREHNMHDRRGARYTRAVVRSRSTPPAAAPIAPRRRGWSGRSSASRARKQSLLGTAAWLAAAEALSMAVDEEDAGVPAVSVR